MSASLIMALIIAVPILIILGVMNYYENRTEGPELEEGDQSANFITGFIIAIVGGFVYHPLICHPKLLEFMQ